MCRRACPSVESCQIDKTFGDSHSTRQGNRLIQSPADCSTVSMNFNSQLRSQCGCHDFRQLCPRLNSAFCDAAECRQQRQRDDSLARGCFAHGRFGYPNSAAQSCNRRLSGKPIAIRTKDSNRPLAVAPLENGFLHYSKHRTHSTQPSVPDLCHS